MCDRRITIRKDGQRQQRWAQRQTREQQWKSQAQRTQTTGKSKQSHFKTRAEHLGNWRDGEDARVLLDMLIKSISICNKYSLYNGDGDWKAIVQAVSHALTEKCAKHLDELINNTNDWGQGGANKHKRIVQELCEKIFKKRGYGNQKDAMRDGLPYQGNDHREAIEQLFEINEILPKMCEGRNKFAAKDFHRNIIVATLHEKARVEFIKRGGRNLRDEDEVLYILEEIQDGIEAEMQIKHANRRRNNNNFKNNDDASTHNNDGHNKNMCHKKRHNHE